MTERKGPWEIFNYGTYKNCPTKDVIRKNPMFFAKCIKTFLNISVEQRDEFFNVTGYDIPEEYVDITYQKPTTGSYNWLYHIEPNYNFDNETF